MRNIFSILLALVLPAVLSLRVSAQEQQEPEDSLVRLLSGKSAQLLEIDGMSYRKIVGPARFFHNNTYLICDTALWNVDTRVIDAIGNVQIIQDQTELQSEKMKYYIDTDLAEFRGDVVQLQDKDNNTLRTKFLDYNTKDSVAVFFRGGSMRDKDGQIIESQTGTYDSKIKTFDFATDVNMFTDSGPGPMPGKRTICFLRNRDGMTADANSSFSPDRCILCQIRRKHGAIPCISTGTLPTYRCTAMYS